MKYDETRVKKVIAEVLEIESDSITKDGDFIDEYDADSLKVLELLASLEKEFDITIPEGELKKFNTLSNVQKVLEAL